ncbi:BTAD domain-containing putative transcriptional regulator [Streptomyces sp. EMB24]|uniref:BTAD domain-containing putative transcriptional regulator n=1 Tax=Streptomyces sp. EMB24 TaxID=2835531 RepID=UPI00227BB6CA|nr:BTAD domain-containing putative transcriptional regulator [Streptomyces sp. EMB24]
MSEGREGEELRAARIRAGLTQEEAARRAGISVRTVRHIERGQVRNPRHASLDRLAGVVGYRRPAVPGAGRDGGRTTPPPAACEIRLLGPLTVLRDGKRVAMPLKLRALLGLLAVQPDQVVRHDEMADVLWPDQPPLSHANLLHTYAARLRRVLDEDTGSAAGRRIRTVRGGYVLDSDGVRLDLREFDERVAHARQTAATAPAEALELYGGALRSRQGRLLEDVSHLWQHPAVVRVAQRHVDVAIDCADLALRLNRPASAVEHLAAAAHEEPLHESLQARMMLALAGSGRRAAALQLFAELRVRLRRELGVEPSQEVWRARHTILTMDAGASSGEPPVPGAFLPPSGAPDTPVNHDGPPAAEPLRVIATPAQLPPPPQPFVGRGEQLDALDALLRPRGTDTAPMGIGIVHGPPETGKSALAVRWAHGHHADFPDGQLYADLRGSGTAPVPPGTVLARFLHSLGVRDAWLPDTTEEAQVLFRSMVAGRRFLLLLDDAADPAQVRALLPGTPGNLVLVTSRAPLTGLVTREGATRVRVGPLLPGESFALLEACLGTHRVAAEPAEAGEFAALCGHLPLAVRKAAARVAASQQVSLRVAVDQLARARGETARRLFRDDSEQTPADGGKARRAPGTQAAALADTDADSVFPG